MHSQTRRSFAGYIALSMAFGSAACSDLSPTSGSQLSARSTVVGQRLSAADTTWDYFSADMTLTYDGGGFVGHPALPRRAVAMRVERSLDADRRWTQKVTFLESPTPGRLRRPIASSAIMDASGMRLLDTAGRVMELPPQVAALLPAGGPRAGSPRGAESREWLDNIVATPGSRERMHGRAAKAYGQAVSRQGGRSTYRVARGDRVAEVVVDDALGAIAEHRIYRGSTLEAHMKYTYESLGDGSYVRRTGKAVSRPSDPRARELAMEVRIENLRFERRGGR